MTDSQAWTDTQFVTIGYHDHPTLPKPAGATSFRGQFDSGVNCRAYYFGQDAAGTTVFGGHNQDAPGPSQLYEDGIPETLVTMATSLAAQWAQGDEQPDSTMRLGYSWLAPIPTVYCAYGTELTRPGEFAVYLTPGLIDTILADSGMVWLAPFLTAYWFTVFDAATLCGSGRPPMPQLGAGDLVWPVLGTSPVLSTISQFFNSGKLRQAFEHVAWGYFCRCKDAPAGQPAPVAYPAPIPQAQPPNATPPPALTCDPNDVCATLAQIGMVVSWNFRLLGDILNGLAGLQTHTAMSVVTGAVHGPIAGSVSLAVGANLYGISVNVITIPNQVGRNDTVEPEYGSLGTVSFFTPWGWSRPVRLRHAANVIDQLPEQVSQVNIDLVHGAVANVVELVRA